MAGVFFMMTLAGASHAPGRIPTGDAELRAALAARGRRTRLVELRASGCGRAATVCGKPCDPRRMRIVALLVGLTACSGSSGGTAGRTSPGSGSPAPVAAVTDPDGPVCAVLRATGPRSVL